MLINKQIKRNRVVYLLLTLVVIILGLASRKFASLLPLFVNLYVGDSLWALMIFCCVGVIFPKAKIWQNSLITIIFCYFIEISQLYHSAWIDELRQNRLAALILGRGFLWSDLVCYTAGIILGLASEIAYLKLLDKKKN
jgi:hypothetical protein